MQLDREIIVRAALQVLDRIGLDRLSLRRLGEALSVKAPALYWHFKNKRELIETMADTILRDEFPDEPGAPGGDDWKDWVKRRFRRLRAAMLSHREGARVVAGASFGSAPTLARFVDETLSGLVRFGLPVLLARDIEKTCVSFTFGHVIEEQAGPEDLPGAIPWLSKHYPAIASAVAALAASDRGKDEDFEIGLDLVLGIRPDSRAEGRGNP